MALATTVDRIVVKVSNICMSNRGSIRTLLTLSYQTKTYQDFLTLMHQTRAFSGLLLCSYQEKTLSRLTDIFMLVAPEFRIPILLPIPSHKWLTGTKYGWWLLLEQWQTGQFLETSFLLAKLAKDVHLTKGRFVGLALQAYMWYCCCCCCCCCDKLYWTMIT